MTAFMNGTSDNNGPTTEQWAAFQKIWGDTFTKLMQLGFTFSPESAPPDLMKQMRAGILQGLSQAWDQFLRSPQFLEGMKQWMDQAMAFRKMSNDFLTKARHETQTPARDDVDAAILTVRHMETRILDRLEAVGAHVKQLQEQVDALSRKAGAAKRQTPKPKSGRKSR